MPYALAGLGPFNLAGPVPRFHSAVTHPYCDSQSTAVVFVMQ
jgi:hypothetical protein